MSKSKKKNIFIGLGIFLGLNFIFTFLPSHVSAGVVRYDGHPQDVAWYGPNAHLEAREARFRIAGSKSSADYKVEVQNACANSTAGTPGMTATYNGVTKNSLNPAHCNGNDFIFNNVPANRILRLEKINGQGHAPFYLRVVHSDPFEDNPKMYITHLATANPDSGVWDVPDEYAGIAMWGGPGLTQEFNPSCTDRKAAALSATGTITRYYKWEDADDGGGDNSNKNAWMRVNYYDKLGSNQKTDTWTESQVGGQGKRGSVPIILFSTTHRVVIEWFNVDGGNAIQMVSPYEYQPDAADCEIEPQGDIGAASCSSIAGWAWDGNRLSQAVNYRITASRGASTAQVTGIANTDDYRTNHGWSASPAGLRGIWGDGSQDVALRLEVRDINDDGSVDGGWTIVKLETRRRPCGGGPPTWTAEVRCDGLLIKGLHDGDHPDDKGRVYYAVYHRAASNTTSPSNPTAVSSGTYTEEGDFVIPWPWGSDDNDNSGWFMDIGYSDYDGSSYASGVTTQRFSIEGGCYQATCSISIPGNLYPGAPAGAVKSGQPFTANVTITNPAANVPTHGWPFGNPAAMSNSYTPNLDIPPVHPAGGSPGGGVLAVTNSVSPSQYSDFPEQPTGSSIGRGGWQTAGIIYSAPPDMTSHTLSVYPDFRDRYGLGPACGGSASDSQPGDGTYITYQPFALPATALVTMAGDTLDENPTSAVGTTTGSQSTAAEVARYPEYSGVAAYTGTITADMYSKLLYRKYVGGAETVLDAESDPDYVFGNLTQALQSSNLPPRDIGDYICANVTLTPKRGWITDGGGTLGTVNEGAEDCDQINNRPFVRSYGGDVFGGTEGVKGYIRDYQASAAGSGAEFAVIALGAVKGFTSAEFRTTAPTPANGLTFAKATNSGVDAVLGGSFASLRTQPDYWGTKYPVDNDRVDGKAIKNITSLDVSTGSLASDKQTHIKPVGGVLTITASGLYPKSKQAAVYVEGDVVIADNIAYEAWGNTAEIPNLSLIVKGNIYINNTVTQLDGLYVSQKYDENNDGDYADANDRPGTIYTCTNGITRYSSTQLHANCTTQLKVNGAFVANDVRFLRTYGTLRDVGVTVIPATSGSNLFDVGWTGTGGTAGKKYCTDFYEPADPWWGQDPATNDNKFCWNSPDPNLFKFYRSLTVAGYTPDYTNYDCISLNNPNESATPGHTWADNSFCALKTADAQLEVAWNQASDPGPALGKTCVNIREDGEPGPWGANKSWVCLKKNGATPEQHIYNRELFGSDHAAESFYLRPELYLAHPVFKPEGGQATSKFDSIITLPPIL